MTRLPTIFLSHGSPMHALDPGGAGEAWRAIAAALPRPRAVLVASAHWETSLPMLTGRDRHDTIHDFSGFPAPLYDLRYDAPGDPVLAEQTTGLLREAGYTAALNACRGLDHGAWVPLRWMYPDVDVPVIQLSLQTSLGTAHHLRGGARPARRRGGAGHWLGPRHAQPARLDASSGRPSATRLRAAFCRVAARTTRRGRSRGAVVLPRSGARCSARASERGAFPADVRGVGRGRRRCGAAASVCRHRQRGTRDGCVRL